MRFSWILALLVPVSLAAATVEVTHTLPLGNGQTMVWGRATGALTPQAWVDFAGQSTRLAPDGRFMLPVPGDPQALLAAGRVAAHESGWAFGAHDRYTRRVSLSTLRIASQEPVEQVLGQGPYFATHGSIPDPLSHEGGELRWPGGRARIGPDNRFTALTLSGQSGFPEALESGRVQLLGPRELATADLPAYRARPVTRLHDLAAQEDARGAAGRSPRWPPPARQAAPVVASDPAGTIPAPGTSAASADGVAARPTSLLGVRASTFGKNAVIGTAIQLAMHGIDRLVRGRDAAPLEWGGVLGSAVGGALGALVPGGPVLGLAAATFAASVGHTIGSRRSDTGRALAEAVGATVGSVAGWVALPMPLVGPMVGGMVGQAAGGFVYDAVVGWQKRRAA